MAEEYGILALASPRGCDPEMHKCEGVLVAWLVAESERLAGGGFHRIDVTNAGFEISEAGIEP